MNARVAEMFAGVGGFRLGLERAGWRVVWSNQWEPSTRIQHASDCYVKRFGPEGHICEDIEVVLRDAAPSDIPDHELLVGGFPCQDYSVAKPLPQAHGIQGKKGVLWWSIHKMIELKRPPLVLLENVDRLLKSPASQRGRDFAIILSCFDQLGYDVEWRVINAADYGFPQRRRRVFIFAARRDTTVGSWNARERLTSTGVFARAFPARFDCDGISGLPMFTLEADPYTVSQHFGTGLRTSPFHNAGVMISGAVWTAKAQPEYSGPRVTLGEVVLKTEVVPERFFIPEHAVERWAYLKGPKAEPRVDKKTGHEYRYSEGGMAFPDPLHLPARTILTGEGGSSPSRFKHVIKDPRTQNLRRLTPEELEELNGFPRGWTDTGMSDTRRAFMMGNALVVGVVEKLGCAIAEEFLADRTKELESRGGIIATHPAADIGRGLALDEGEPRQEHEPGAVAAASAS